MSITNFIITYHDRSGSHLLVSLLNSHPEVYCEGEVFNKLNETECNLYFQKYLNSEQRRNKTKGFKMPYSFQTSRRNNIWHKSKGNTQFKIIHLSRSNLLRAYISNEIAKKTAVWYGGRSKQPNLNEKIIKLNAKDCLLWINSTLRQQKKSEYDFRHHISFTLTYENFLFDDNKINELFKFLGVDPNHKASTPLKKQNPEPLNQLISNYEEFKNDFENSEWADFLDEDQANEFGL